MQRIEETYEKTIIGGSTLIRRVVYNDNDTHNIHGPAIEEWDRDTKLKTYEAYFVDDQLHRVGAPAETRWNKDGIIEEECYYHHGNSHNENGPAYISYYESGKVAHKFYYIHDVCYKEEEYYKKYPNAAGNSNKSELSSLVDENICSACGNKDDYLAPHKHTGKLVCYKCC